MAAKRLKKATRARKTVGDLDRRTRALKNERNKRYRAQFTPEERRQMYADDLRRCCDLEWLESMCKVDDVTGCWHWQGAWRRVFQSVRPEARRGSWGSMDARRAVWNASRGVTLPPQIWVVRTCDCEDCIAPHHLATENQALRSAKRRSADHGKEEGLRVRAG